MDEPRAEKPEDTARQSDFFATDARGRQLKGWTNKLIWGDNKLIYIDPPFDVGADFSMNIEIGEGDNKDTFTKKRNILEEIAYRDTWGKGANSFIAMIYERLVHMRNLLAEDGSIYVHCDWRITPLIRLCLDEIFGNDNYINECIWSYKTGGMPENIGYGRKHDTIHFVSKNRPKTIWNMQKIRSYLSHNYGFSNIELFTDEKAHILW